MGLKHGGARLSREVNRERLAIFLVKPCCAKPGRRRFRCGIADHKGGQFEGRASDFPFDFLHWVGRLAHWFGLCQGGLKSGRSCKVGMEETLETPKEFIDKGGCLC